MSAQPAPPLTNVQLELLKVFALGVTDEEVLEIRRMLARYFMQKAVSGATKVWEERGYTEEQLLAVILRPSADRQKTNRLKTYL